MYRLTRGIVGAILFAGFLMPTCYAIDGGTLRMNPRNGWLALEIITTGDNPTGDGVNWSMPGTFDGIGAWLPDSSTLRLAINHETSDATISEVNLNRDSFQTAIDSVLHTGNSGGISFVTSARQAYDRWSDNAGGSWTSTSNVSNTSFSRFCSSQSYEPHTFGTDRGFVDNIYITGEEVSAGRLFALDLANRDFYRVSGVVGSASGGIGGMPFDAWENAALVDTGETNHVALVLSPDGGTQRMQLYIGEKGKDASGNASNSFLARNGLAFGSYYYFNGSLPSSGTFNNGFFDTTTTGSLVSAKLEDLDTNPNSPNQFVLGVQETGLFTFDLSLDFASGNFNSDVSSFSVTKTRQHNDNTDGLFGDADNVDWSRATTLGDVTHPEGLVFVNEDSGTSGGETWMMAPNGSGLTLIADTIGQTGASESSGVLDVSLLLGYRPGSILLTSNQGSNSSLTALINPHATLAADYNVDGVVDAADYTIWRDSLGMSGTGLPADGNADGQIDASDYEVWRSSFGRGQPIAGSGAIGDGAVPEPTAVALFAAMVGCFVWRTGVGEQVAGTFIAIREFGC